MPLVTCEAHGNDTVVAYNRVAYSTQQCPLCVAEEKITELEDALDAAKQGAAA